jgi:hypothetical protein
MLKRFYFIRLMLIVFIVLIDILVYFEINASFQIDSIYFLLIYWVISSVFILFLLSFSLNKNWVNQYQKTQRTLFSFFGAFILFYVPKLVFLVLSLIGNLVNIFLTENIYILSYTGVGIAVLLFLAILYGIAFGKYHFKVERRSLNFFNLPEEWNGLRIIHISDLHIGSWPENSNQLKKAVELINREQPDLIFFTGDLVNNKAEEVLHFVPTLQNMNASMGKYSILGNHDYGDYFPWASKTDKEENLEYLKNIHQKTGFKLLLNDSDVLEGLSDNIGIAGVENWGLPPFHQYGDLKKAFTNLDGKTKFNILLSHDPSHWRAEVLNNKKVDLTLSGHTHGMQFGISLNGFKWSPAKWKYPEWGGFYTSGKQKLYVSTGLGFIGFPGRVGIRPKITVIDLYRQT